MESEGMLRHLAFFEELGKMDETDASWRSVSAGLVVMRLVDNWIEDGATPCRVDSWGVSAVREAIAQVPETTPLRRILCGIVDVVVSSTSVDLHALIPRLMAYGQALEYDAKWAIAADVYQTIVAHAHPVDDADLVVTAFIQLAFCLRTVGDFDGAAAAYERASRVALAAGDLIGVLRSRLGDAKIATARGNMPQAEAIIEETIARAAAGGLDEIRSRALSEHAYVVSLCGEWDRMIRYSYEAMELPTTERERDRMLNNIATGFRHLGLVDVARDAYLVLAATAQEQYVRWMSELNLMELAAEERVELQFDKYRRDLESANFTPLLRVTYLLHVGRGYHLLGNSAAGIPYLERAVEMAAHHKLNQLLFESEGALADASKENSVPKPKAIPFVDGTMQNVIDAISEMKETAGIS